MQSAYSATNTLNLQTAPNWSILFPSFLFVIFTFSEGYALVFLGLGSKKNNRKERDGKTQRTAMT
jgi:hypothetical protein